MTRRTHSFNAYESPLKVGVGATGDVIVDDPTNLVADLYLVIDPEDALLREYIKVTAVNGTTGELTCAGDRGLPGSADGIAHAHDVDAPVRAVAVHQWLDDIFDDIIEVEDWAADHVDIGAVADPHTQYLTEPEGDVRYIEVAGDTMSGVLTLYGTDPTGDDEATPKLWVELVVDSALGIHNNDPGAHLNLDTYLPLDGTGQMTGTLQMNSNYISGVTDGAATNDAVNKSQLDAVSAVFDDYLPLTGGVLTGTLEVATAVLVRGDAGARAKLTFLGDDAEGVSEIHFGQNGGAAVRRMLVNPDTGEIDFYEWDGGTKFMWWDQVGTEVNFDNAMRIANLTDSTVGIVPLGISSSGLVVRMQ